MGSSGLKIGGFIVTVLLHVGLGVLALSHVGSGGPADAAAARFDDAVTIEASLAFKEVKPQSRQPQKQRKAPAPPPEAPKIDSDAVVPAEPEEEKPKPKPRPKSNEIDIEETLKEHRLRDDELSSTGVDEVPQEGSADGSKWGTEADAKGHPYAGELKGRIWSVWEVPLLETGGGEPEGCVKLDASGKIVDRYVRKKSGNANVDRSVEVALRRAPDMEQDVPDELRTLITVNGICFRFKKTQEGD